MTDALSDAASGVGNFVGGAANDIGSGISSAASGIGNWFGGGSGGLPGATSTAGDPLSGAASTVAQGATAVPGMGGGGMTPATFGGAPSSIADSITNGGLPGTGSTDLGLGTGGGGAAPAGGGAGDSGITTPNLTPAAPPDLSGVTNIQPNVGGINPKATGGLGGLLTPKNALTGGALGYALMQGLSSPPQNKELSRLAGQDAANAQTYGNLASTAINGQLPGPAMAALNQAKQAAQAQVRAKYAGMGLSGSSAEAQDLANVEQSSVAQQFQIGQQMAQTGLSELNTSQSQEGSLYEALLKEGTAQGTQLGDILAKFAGAAVGG